MSDQSITGVFKEATGMSIGWAVVMIVLGFAAVFLPFATGIGVSVLVGWIIVFGGFASLAFAFAAQGAGVVVNDLGVDVDGDNPRAVAAESVVGVLRQAARPLRPASRRASWRSG